jgi:hypothetical protein
MKTAKEFVDGIVAIPANVKGKEFNLVVDLLSRRADDIEGQFMGASDELDDLEATLDGVIQAAIHLKAELIIERKQ